FFQAEDGIRDDLVTGVQTCALPISAPRSANGRRLALFDHFTARLGRRPACGSHDPRAISPLASAGGRPAARTTLEPFHRSPRPEIGRPSWRERAVDCGLVVD